MSSPNTVHVKNINSATDDKEIREFFSFCGKITDVSVSKEGDSKSATVTFEKETAAKTALLLNNTQLGPSQIAVTAAPRTRTMTRTTRVNATRTRSLRRRSRAAASSPSTSPTAT